MSCLIIVGRGSPPLCICMYIYEDTSKIGKALDCRALHLIKWRKPQSWSMPSSLAHIDILPTPNWLYIDGWVVWLGADKDMKDRAKEIGHNKRQKKQILPFKKLSNKESMIYMRAWKEGAVVIELRACLMDWLIDWLSFVSFHVVSFYLAFFLFWKIYNSYFCGWCCCFC